MRRKQIPKTHVVVLLSGGIDSAATLAAYRAKGHSVEAFFVDYGQPARRSEWHAAQAVAEHYNTPITRARLGVRLPSEGGEFFGRNALLMLLAGAVTMDRPLVIAAGINASSIYYDTTANFVGDVQRLFDGYTCGAISLGVPFLEMTKPTVVKFARRHRVPLDLTYSCERRNAPPCGACPSCGDRKACRVK
jgi:7-cyano-7-deazaguanine synthase